MTVKKAKKTSQSNPEIILTVGDTKAFNGWKLIITANNFTKMIPITAATARDLVSMGIPQEG